MPSAGRVDAGSEEMAVHRAPKVEALAVAVPQVDLAIGREEHACDIVGMPRGGVEAGGAERGKGKAIG